MFKITDNQDIYLTRGDTAEFRPVIEDYTAKENDVVVFAVKKVLTSAEPVIKKTVAAGENITFTKVDTSNLSSGTYLYDMKLITEDGEISTFVNGKRFILLGDVDNARD